MVQQYVPSLPRKNVIYYPITNISYDQKWVLFYCEVKTQQMELFPRVTSVKRDAYIKAFCSRREFVSTLHVNKRPSRKKDSEDRTWRRTQKIELETMSNTIKNVCEALLTSRRHHKLEKHFPVLKRKALTVISRNVQLCTVWYSKKF
jgi:hypothetical protein